MNPDLTIGRLLTALAIGCVVVGFVTGVEAWMLDNPSFATPWLTRIGFALFVASGAYGWLRGRAERKISR